MKIIQLKNLHLFRKPHVLLFTCFLSERVLSASQKLTEMFKKISATTGIPPSSQLLLIIRDYQQFLKYPEEYHYLLRSLYKRFSREDILVKEIVPPKLKSKFCLAKYIYNQLSKFPQCKRKSVLVLELQQYVSIWKYTKAYVVPIPEHWVRSSYMELTLSPKYKELLRILSKTCIEPISKLSRRDLKFLCEMGIIEKVNSRDYKFCVHEIRLKLTSIITSGKHCKFKNVKPEPR